MVNIDHKQQLELFIFRDFGYDENIIGSIIENNITLSFSTIERLYNISSLDEEYFQKKISQIIDLCNYEKCLVLYNKIYDFFHKQYFSTLKDRKKNKKNKNYFFYFLKEISKKDHGELIAIFLDAVILKCNKFLKKRIVGELASYIDVKKVDNRSYTRDVLFNIIMLGKKIDLCQDDINVIIYNSDRAELIQLILSGILDHYMHLISPAETKHIYETLISINYTTFDILFNYKISEFILNKFKIEPYKVLEDTTNYLMDDVEYNDLEDIFFEKYISACKKYCNYWNIKFNLIAMQLYENKRTKHIILRKCPEDAAYAGLI